MSLIPSESYSFPDHFTKTVTPSRKPKEEPAPEIEEPGPENEIVPMPPAAKQNGESSHHQSLPTLFKREATREIAAVPNPAEPVVRKISLPRTPRPVPRRRP